MPRSITKGNLLMSAESPDNQMSRLAQNEFSFGRTIPMQSVIDNIDAVTPADLLALAEELWNGGKAAMTMVGPGVDGTDFSEQLAL
jgi:predicted Zn-dependent peptidase